MTFIALLDDARLNGRAGLPWLVAGGPGRSPLSHVMTKRRGITIRVHDPRPKGRDELCGSLPIA
jgi:hypothetical protein